MLLNTGDMRAPAVAAPPARDPLVAWRRWIMTDTSSYTQPRPTIGRVLLISYQFPPTGGSGVQRPAKLVKYLPSLGWEVEVLTAAHDRFPWSDPSLLDDLAESCRIHRATGLEPACLARLATAPLSRLVSPAGKRWLEDRLYWRLIRLTAATGRGNGEALWTGSATRAALRLHHARPFDAVISTGPPHFVHEAAMRISYAAGLPWIADLRDPPVSDFDREPARSARGQAMHRLERAVLRNAAIVTTTCPAFAHDLRARYPDRRPDTIRAITNGFDRDDLRPVLSAAGADVDECRFVAAGALYGRREISRLVTPLLDVLEAHPEWRNRVQLVLAGSIDAQQRRHWERNRPDWLTLAGYLDHASALRLAASAACNIVMVPDCRHGHLSVPGKLFELLALPTHVLALAPESGDTARIAQAAGGATLVPLEAAGRVASALERIITDHFAGCLIRERDWWAVDTYDRRVITAEFADCLEAARGESPCDR